MKRFNRYYSENEVQNVVIIPPDNVGYVTDEEEEAGPDDIYNTYNTKSNYKIEFVRALVSKCRTTQTTHTYIHDIYVYQASLSSPLMSARRELDRNPNDTSATVID